MSETNRRSLPSVGVVAAIAALGLLSACASKPATEASAPDQPSAQPSAGGVASYEPATHPTDDPAEMTLDQAALTFEHAELQLAGLVGMGGTVPPAAEDGDGTRVGVEPAPKSAKPTGEFAEGPDRCLTACRALASMQRSATRMCELIGEDDARCDSVRDRVERARQLVYGECPSCLVAQPTDE